MADCHLGAFGRNPSLREYNLKAFEKAIEKSIEAEVDFIIIAGDLFHNPHPDMDIVNRAVRSLMEARSKGIRIYSVYGSHDFNISKASLIDVLESAEVFKKVVHYLESENSLEHVEDESGISIAGLSGRKNRMDVSYYENLDFERTEGDSIFVFHTPIAELKPADIHEEESIPLSSLPEGYKYYAGGHIHRRIEGDLDGKPVIYPGPTFGSSYTDLEKDIDRGFYIVEDWKIDYVPIEVCKINRELINADGMKIDELNQTLLELSGEKVNEEVVLLKIEGKLSEGMPEDIDFTNIRRRFEKNGANTVYLNRRNLEGRTGEKIKIKEGREDEIEEDILKEYEYPDGITSKFAKEMLNTLRAKQRDGETKNDYENRIWEESLKLIENIDRYKVEEAEKENGKKEKKSKTGQISLSDFGGDL